MLGTINPQIVRITQQAVVYPNRDHVTSLRVERFDGRTYKPVDMTAVTRVILSFPEADPVIVYDSSVQAVFTHVGTTLTVDLSDYAMPASVLGCQIILYDAEHPAGQVLVDDIDAEVQFDFRNVSPVGGIPAPAVDYLTDAPIDGVTYARKDGVWVPVDALVSGVSSVNGQSGVVVLTAADVGADAAGTGASQAASAVAAHVALSDPHPQYLTPAEGNTAYDAIGAAASAVGTHVAASDPHPQYLTPTEGNAAYDALGAAASAVSTHVAASDPHPQYNTQAEGDARYERNLTAGANITIDRTNPAAPVISASGGGGGGGAVDSVNGQTGVVVLGTDDIAEGVSNLYFTNGRAAAAAPVQTVDGQTGAVSLSSSYAPLSHVGDGGAAHSNAVAAGAAGFMTGADKTKLDGIAAGAQVNVATDLSMGTITTTTIPLNSSTGTDVTLPAATPSLAGLQSAADKTKLDGIAAGASANPMTTAGDIIVGGVAGAPARLALGTEGQILAVVGDAPAWVEPELNTSVRVYSEEPVSPVPYQLFMIVLSPDVTAPTVTAFTATSGVTSPVPITAFTATDDIGVTGYWVGTSSAEPALGDPGWSATPQTSFATASTGLVTLYARARDAAGNISAAASQAVVVADSYYDVSWPYNSSIHTGLFSVAVGGFTTDTAIPITPTINLTIKSVMIPMRKQVEASYPGIGTVQLQIRSGSPTGTVLSTATAVVSSSGAVEVKTFTLPSNLSLASGTTYYLTLSLVSQSGGDALYRVLTDPSTGATWSRYNAGTWTSYTGQSAIRLEKA